MTKSLSQRLRSAAHDVTAKADAASRAADAEEALHDMLVAIKRARKCLRLGRKVSRALE